MVDVKRVLTSAGKPVVNSLNSLRLCPMSTVGVSGSLVEVASLLRKMLRMAWVPQAF